MDDLRHKLLYLDSSSQAVQQAASAMMKHYEQAMVAVNEWRNALQMASGEQLIALLYVANEVLQNSKRNRGLNFVQSLRPVMKDALVHMCQRDRTKVEQVRRVVKIWGDRQVFTFRFVNECIDALNPYRDVQKQQKKTTTAPAPTSQPPKRVAPAPAQPKQQQQEVIEIDLTDDKDDDDDDDDDDILKILRNREKNDHDDDSSENSDLVFANDNPDSLKLHIDLNLESLASNTELQSQDPTSSNLASPSKAQQQDSNKRRRRSLDSNSSDTPSGKRRGSLLRRKSNTLITDGVATWQRLVQLNQSFYHAQLVLERIDTKLKNPTNQELAVQPPVGDALQQAFAENTRFQRQIVEQRQILHSIATERYAIEQDCLRYLPWLEQAVQQDEDDLTFCDNLVAKINSFVLILPSILRGKEKRMEEARKQQEEEEKREAERKRQEEDKKFREAALAKETEAKPGMVWNPTTREYQALNTDESWRD